MKLLFLFIIIPLITYVNASGRRKWEEVVSSSVHDLARLFHIELKLIGELSSIKFQDGSEDEIVISQFWDTISMSQINVTIPEEYVRHPVNSYHLLKRATLLWPKLFDRLKDNRAISLKNKYIDDFPTQNDFEYGAAFGLMTIQNYYEQDPMKLLNGVLINPKSKKLEYKSIHTLTYEDAAAISMTSRATMRLDKHTFWAQVSLDRAIAESAPKSVLSNLKRALKAAQTLHDDSILSHGFCAKANWYSKIDGLPNVPLFSHETLFDQEELEEIPSYLESAKKFKVETREIMNSFFTDIRPLDSKDGSFLQRSYLQVWCHLQPITRRLCRSQTTMDRLIRPHHIDIKHKCIYLHRGDPYLRLGPFQYEVLNSDPHIGIFRGMFIDDEISKILNSAENQYESTEYHVNTGEKRLYTSQRISKRFHVDDKDFSWSMKASKRLSLATDWKIKQRYHNYDEHYHIINYGIGGQIEVHVDHWGPDTATSKHPGGDRIATILTYLTEVEAGGRTVFPLLGLSVKPERGSVLFWVTVKQDQEYDSRMFHMGCPVMYGEKTVMTKWLYSDDQMWAHPCDGKPGKNYREFKN